MNQISTPAASSAGVGDRVVSLSGVLVTFDLGKDVAYVAYEGRAGISWDEVSREDGELLARLGAAARIHLTNGARFEVDPNVQLAGRSA
jgi:hypothetical protein